MSLPKSISTNELAELAAKAAKDVLGDRNHLGGELSIGKWPIGTVGLIWRNPDFEKFDAREMSAISSKMVAAMGPSIGKVEPATLIFEDIVVAGYFPIQPTEFLRLK